MSGDKIKREFEERVVADTARRVDDATNGLIDWMGDSGPAPVARGKRIPEQTYAGRLALLKPHAGTSNMTPARWAAGSRRAAKFFLRSVVQEARTVIKSFYRRQEARRSRRI